MPRRLSILAEAEGEGMPHRAVVSLVGISIQRHARRCRSGSGDGETRLLVEGGVEKHKGVWLWWGSRRTRACRGHRVGRRG